jgi:hypothetical protein
MLFSKRSKVLLVISCLLIAVLSPLPATIQVGFPVIARTGNTNTYATSTGALTSGDCVSIDANGNYIDSGVAGCGGSGAGKGGIVVYSAASLTLTGTQFIPIGGGGLPSSTETNVDTSAPSAATVTNFDVQMSSAPGVGNNVVFTWRQNAGSTALTCTISGAVATSCNDSTHSFVVAQGDLLTIQLVSTGVIAGTPNLVVSTQFGTTGSNGTVNTGTINQTAFYAAAGTAVSGVGPGSTGQVYTSNGSGSPPSFTTVPTANQNIRTIGATFGSFESGATALSGSHTACVPTYFAGTIQSVELIGDVSGSATVDVLTVAHGSWTGRASASSITAAAIPALASAAAFTDSTLTGWNKTVTAGTDVCFALTSPTTVAGVAIAVKVAAN